MTGADLSWVRLVTLITHNAQPAIAILREQERRAQCAEDKALRCQHELAELTDHLHSILIARPVESRSNRAQDPQRRSPSTIVPSTNLNVAFFQRKMGRLFGLSHDGRHSESTSEHAAGVCNTKSSMLVERVDQDASEHEDLLPSSLAIAAKLPTAGEAARLTPAQTKVFKAFVQWLQDSNLPKSDRIHHSRLALRRSVV